jgi:DMSO/TMAO reductase YedYZ molybdopterin-dependent catalytic subunit
MAKKRPTRARPRQSLQVLPGAGLILREREPLNLESPQSALRDWITPADQFYVRNHFAEPSLARATWRLRVEGAVKTPGNFSCRDLTAMATQSHVTVMECAGNGRGFLTPKEEGTQWQAGAAGNAEFTGVPLTALLERVGILSTAVDVMFEGADHGEIEDEPRSRATSISRAACPSRPRAPATYCWPTR